MPTTLFMATTHMESMFCKFHCRLSLTMLIELRKNRGLEVTQFSVPTTSATVNVNWRVAQYVNSRGGHDIIVIHGTLRFSSRLKRSSNLGLKARRKLLVNLGQPRLDLPNLLLHHPDTQGIKLTRIQNKMKKKIVLQTVSTNYNKVATTPTTTITNKLFKKL